MKPIQTVVYLVACLMLSSYTASGASVKGNSGYGIGNGQGTWNFTSQLLGPGDISQRSYNGGTSAVFALPGGNAWEQVDCFNTGAECDPNQGATAPYTYTILFNFSKSLISGKSVIFHSLSGFSGLPSDVFLLTCNMPPPNNPGGLCSNIPLTLTIATSFNPKTNTLTFMVPTLSTGITDLTLGITEAQNGLTSDTFVNPTVGFASPVPEPTSILLLATGVASIAVRRRFKRAV
jgi:hypothetical protein